MNRNDCKNCDGRGFVHDHKGPRVCPECKGKNTVWEPDPRIVARWRGEKEEEK